MIFSDPMAGRVEKMSAVRDEAGWSSIIIVHFERYIGGLAWTHRLSGTKDG
jgi:hypothetical protein